MEFRLVCSLICDLSTDTNAAFTRHLLLLHVFQQFLLFAKVTMQICFCFNQHTMFLCYFYHWVMFSVFTFLFKQYICSCFYIDIKKLENSRLLHLVEGKWL